MEREREHLKHLIFNDTCSMYRFGANHNAMDRSGCYDIFLLHLASPIFTCHYNVGKEIFERNKSKMEDADGIEVYANEYANNAYDWLMKKKLAE